MSVARDLVCERGERERKREREREREREIVVAAVLTVGLWRGSSYLG